MADALQQRADEKKIYEELVNVIVDTASLHYPEDGEARLRIYEKVADNFAGMVKSLRKPPVGTPNMIQEIENGLPGL